MTRTKIIKVRVSPEEESQLLAKAGSLPLSKFMREFCLGNDLPAKQITKISDPKLVRQLSIIGGLLNQVMRVANTQIKSGKPFDILRLSSRVEATRSLLSEMKNVG